MSTLNGWLTTKKSPAEIARDKKKAAEIKRKKNSKAASSRPKSSRGRKKSSYAEDSDFSGGDEDDEEDNFIVDDDNDDLEVEESEDEVFDSELEDEDEEDEDEEIVLHDDEDSEDGIDRSPEKLNPVVSTSRSSRVAARKPRGGKPTVLPIDDDSDSDDSDDDDDSDMDSFLPTSGSSLRKSAPSKLLKRNAEAAKKRFNPSLEASRSSVMMNGEKKKRKTLNRLKTPALKKLKTKSNANATNNKQRNNLDDSDDDDDEEVTSPCYTPNKPKQQSNGNGNINGNDNSDFRPHVQDYKEIFTSDEENENNINLSTQNRNKKPSKGPSSAVDLQSRYFEGQQKKPNNPPPKNMIVLDDSDGDSDSSDDDEEPNKPQFKSNTNDATLEDTPDPSNQDRKRRLNKKVSKMSTTGVSNKFGSRVTLSIQDSSDEDGFDDEDIKVAMKLSLVENNSNKPQQEPNGSKKATNEKKNKTVERIELVLDDSSDDEEDGDVGEEYYDEEKETASNVLRSAKRLSGHVVRAMSRWFESKDNDGDKKNQGGGAVQGIIVDGAISLGNLGADGSSSKAPRSEGDNTWISKEVMKKAIPNVTLSGYQLIGVNWMALLNGMTCEVGTKGTKNVNGVLADEMGLGKTVQTIAFLAWLKHRRQTRVLDLESPGGSNKEDISPPLPHLIVVPLSTLPNWIREFEKFCPEFRVVKYHGTQQEREVMKEELREHLPKYFSKHVAKRTQLDVIVAPVSYFQKENSPDRKFLTSFKYDYLVVDEAHNLKNAKSTRYKMLDKVKTEHRLLLTGTPVQNNPQELLNMLSFIMPLFSKASSPFEETDNHTEQMLKHFVDETAEHGDEQTAYKKLKHLFAPFVLRRRKDDVIAQLLPKKERKTIFVDLAESTRSIYKSILRSHFDKNGSTISPGTGEHLFTNLRKCAHHPLLLRNRWNTPSEKDQLIRAFIKHGAFRGDACTVQRVGEEMQSWNDFEIHLTALDLITSRESCRKDLGQYLLEQNDLFSSSKFENLRSLLPDLISDGHRILIFSSWTSCLDLLGCLMQHLGILFQRMDGSTSSEVRQELIDRFNNDRSYSVFLLSTKACGLGINLTSADTCILHDLDFNPFNDLQAEDRCHRIGQKKPVTVYKLISKDTVDEDIYKMQEKKAKMNAAIMDSSTSRKEKSAILKSVLEKEQKAL